MNIFYLDENPKACAEMHCDKHVVKMILELAQLLSTAHRVLDGTMYVELTKTNRKTKRYSLSDFREKHLYKATHINHPSAIWVRETRGNYEYTYNLFVELCKEYTHRYGKTHLTETKLKKALEIIPENIKAEDVTMIPQAMPDYCKDSDPIQGYRNYYKLEKSNILQYTNRNKPYWL